MSSQLIVSEEIPTHDLAAVVFLTEDGEIYPCTPEILDGNLVLKSLFEGGPQDPPVKQVTVTPQRMKVDFALPEEIEVQEYSNE